MVRKNVARAINAIKSKKMDFKKAAKMYNVPQSVLNHCHGKNKLAIDATKN
jgi:helix-turn-helix, Psq domain.